MLNMDYKKKKNSIKYIWLQFYSATIVEAPKAQAIFEKNLIFSKDNIFITETNTKKTKKIKIKIDKD